VRKSINNKGVTIVELLAVIVIIGIISGIAVALIGGLIEKQKINAAYASFDSSIAAAENYLNYESLATNDTFTTTDLVLDGYLDFDPFDSVVTFSVGIEGDILIINPSNPTNNGITADSDFYTKWIAIYATDLIISEYVEGVGDYKAIEIFNGTGATIQLTGYTLRIYFGGATTTYTTITLSGSISHNDVYIVTSPTLFSTLPVADLSSAKLTFNGDDVVALVHSGVLIDIIGQIGNDPGTEWGSGLQSTLDNTLVRQASVIQGDSIGTNQFLPSIEWIGYATNTYGNLGTHESNVTDSPKS